MSNATLADGRTISAYGLSCGYSQSRYPSSGVHLNMWKEHNTYHVRAHDHNTDTRVFWYTTESLALARAVYRAGRPPQEVQS